MNVKMPLVILTPVQFIVLGDTKLYWLRTVRFGARVSVRTDTYTVKHQQKRA